MTLAQLKALFRRNVKVVPGGPAVGTPGANRAAGVLAALDGLADFADASSAAEPITYADLLAELNTNGVVRQKWFRLTARTNGQPDITVYFTNPADPAGWGDDETAHLQPDGTSTRTRWAKYRLLSDAFEYDQSLGGGTSLPLTATRTADYTLALADAGCLVPVSSGSAVVVTVPAHADIALPVGTTLYVAQDGAGAVTIAWASGVVVQTADGYKVPGQWTDVALHKRDLNTWVLKGGVS